MTWKDDLKAKLRELGWWVVVALVRWILERLTADPAEKDEGGAEKKHE